MKCAKTLSIPALALIAAMPLSGQDAAKASKKNMPQDAAMALPTFLKIEVGNDAIIHDAADVPLGTMRDHVFDNRTGKILYVAVEPAENDETGARLVPYERFEWDRKHQKLQLDLSMGDLKSMPAYEPAAFGAKDAREASANKLSPVVGTELVGTAIMASDEAFGSVTEILIEPQRGALAFVLARTGASKEDPLIIPWRAMIWESTPEVQGRLVITSKVDDLAAAPTLHEGDPSNLKQADVLEGIYGFYKVSPPPFPAPGSGRDKS